MILYQEGEFGLVNNMTTMLLTPDTTIFPAHYRHTDDTTICLTPADCDRELYVKAGPAAVWHHNDDDTICHTPLECSANGRNATLWGAFDHH